MSKLSQLPVHSTIGGIHGKIGFIFAGLCVGHALKRLKSPVLRRKSHNDI